MKKMEATTTETINDQIRQLYRAYMAGQIANTEYRSDVADLAYKPLLASVLRRPSNPYERDEAQDMLHDALVKFITHSEPGPDFSCYPLAWFRAVIRNNIVDRYYRRQLQTGDEVPERSELHPALTQQSLARLALDDALDRVRPEWRKVAEICLRDGMTENEAGQKLGLSRSTVNYYKLSALEQLREDKQLNEFWGERARYG